MDNKEINNTNSEVRVRNRKEIVKNIIIVFLLVMLLLTFFSNTIMNYSLPEVSVTRMSRSSVSKAYQLDLTAEANKKYTVTADENRDIKRVAVKRGQEVKEGQVLFFLADVKDSSEAEALQEEIDQLKVEYEKSIMSVARDYYDQNLAISQARDRLNSAVAAKNNAANQPVPEDNSGIISSLLQKKNLLTKDLEAITSGSYSLMSSERYSQISELSEKSIAAQKEFAEAETEYNRYTERYQAAGGDAGVKTMEERTLADMERVLNRLREDKADARVIEDKEIEIKRFKEDIDELKAVKELITVSKTNLDKKTEEKNNAENALSKKISEITGSINSELSSIETQLSELEGSSVPGGSLPDGADTDYDAAIREAQYALDSAIHTLEIQMETDRIADAQTQLDFDAQKKKIEDLEKDLEELVNKQASSEVVSPVEGVVESINFSSGQSFAENDELMIINISDDGFTASASVSSEQAKAVTKGKEARIADNTNDVTVTVKNITKDKQDSSKFNVVFSLSGDVVEGQNIKIELGESASPYDKVIPRNSVKQDSSGKFVYAVRSKSTPLGNRYIVEKVAVVVVAEDDTQCAVTGDFGDAADYIITASSKPFKSGDQVRFAQE